MTPFPSDSETGSERFLVSSGSPYEPTMGFSRAVRVGRMVFVAGTSPIMPEGADPPDDAYGQAARCLEIIRGALEEAGAALRHVVRTTVYLTAVEASEGVGRAHGELFGEIRPASTMVAVDRLLDPRWMVEISADAVIHDER
jgi:enamine deaminase RidA (YjgF/YER057c/UK114 family)